MQEMQEIKHINNNIQIAKENKVNSIFLGMQQFVNIFIDI